MSPVLMEGDVVAWTPTKIEDIKTGDVIVFKSFISWPDEKIVVHRVSDIITNSKGKLLLETKGDRNDWTDQTGPHIPEPYIRNENLMGKVISIGQLPLKFPFIGIIGILINQGVEQISQPSTNKDSTSYIGIFAPLTISAVIFVVLIFILPERAKTIKEKIRFFIFGPRPLNLKKTLVAFLIAYIVFLSFIHLFAFDSITASVGVNINNEDASIEFGNIKPGYESTIRDLPVINPSIMPVKGFVFGNGELGNFVTKKCFNLSNGNTTNIIIRAIAPANITGGVYSGDIMVFSSPFWVLFSDKMIEILYNINPELAIFILDLFAALLLTGITVFVLISITFIGDRLSNFLIDRSWIHPSRFILKKSIITHFKTFNKKIKKAFAKNIGWVLKIEYKPTDSKEAFLSQYGKPLIASFVIIPILIVFQDPMVAMLISVTIGVIFAYLISCKARKKIVLTVLITMIIGMIHMMVQSNIIIIDMEAEILEMLSLSVGVTGVYILIFTLFLIPFSAFAWYVTRFFRNLKEQKDPLLSLEGNCDL